MGIWRCRKNKTAAFCKQNHLWQVGMVNFKDCSPHNCLAGSRELFIHTPSFTWFIHSDSGTVAVYTYLPIFSNWKYKEFSDFVHDSFLFFIFLKFVWHVNHRFNSFRIYIWFKILWVEKLALMFLSKSEILVGKLEASEWPVSCKYCYTC